MIARKNLQRIEQYLKDHAGEHFSRVDIRDALNINYYSTVEWLEYLYGRGSLDKINDKGTIKYGWRSDEPVHQE